MHLRNSRGILQLGLDSCLDLQRSFCSLCSSQSNRYETCAHLWRPVSGKMSPDFELFLRILVRRNSRAWNRKFPKLGPCFPVAEALVQLGLADSRAHSFYRMKTGRIWWHHWVNFDKAGMVDVAGPWITSLNAQPEYRDICYTGWARGLRWNQSHVDWWIKRLTQ